MSVLELPSPYPDEMLLTTQDDRSGAIGIPAATASYWVQEEDGTSKWIIEEGGGFWLTEESS